jgi:WD40 repeat protein
VPVLQVSAHTSPSPRSGESLRVVTLSPSGRVLWTVHGVGLSADSSIYSHVPALLLLSAWDASALTWLGCLGIPGLTRIRSLVAIGEERRVLLVGEENTLLCDLEQRRIEVLSGCGKFRLSQPPLIDRQGLTILLPMSGTKEGPNTLLQIESTTGRRLSQPPVDYSTFALSADGQRLAQLQEETLHVWRLPDGTPLMSLPIETHYMRPTMCFDHSGNKLAVCYSDRLLCIDIPSCTVLWQAELGLGPNEHMLAFSPSDRVIWCGSLGPSHWLGAFTADKGTPIGRSHRVGAVVDQQISLADSGARFAESTGTKELLLLDLGEDGLCRPCPIQPTTIDHVVLLPAHHLIATAGPFSETVTCYNYLTQTAGPEVELKCGGVRELHCGVDGESLHIVGKNGSLWTWRPSAPSAPMRWACSFVYSSMLTLGPGGRSAICNHGLIDGLRGRRYRPNSSEERDVLTLWDVRTGTLIEELTAAIAPAQSLAWVSDQPLKVRERIGNTIYTIDLAKQTRVSTGSFPTPSSHIDSPSPRLLPNGQQVLTCDIDRLVLWDIETERVSTEISATDRVRVLAISPSCRRILLATAGRVEIRRLDRAGEVESFIQLSDGDGGQSGCFSPREDRIAIVTTLQRVLSAPAPATD